MRIILAILTIAALSYSQAVFVPGDHAVYNFLDRMETKGVVQNLLAGTKPLTRSEILRYLKSVNSNSLNSVEAEQLIYFLTEFDVFANPENRIEKLKNAGFIRPWLPDFVYNNNKNLFSYQDEKLNLFWDPIIVRRIVTANDKSGDERRDLQTATNGFKLWGSLSNYFGFLVDIRDTKESGADYYPNKRNYTRQRMGFVRGGGDHEYHDETIAYMTMRWKNFQFQFGKDANLWGPGNRGQLAVSDHATSYDQIKMQFLHRKLKFTSFIGFLKNYDDEYFYGSPKEKLIAAHRVEFSLFGRFDIGLHETVIFADRKFEPAYYNPFMFYRSAEHYLGDRDNATMGLDVELKLVPKTKIYGELFIDDLTTSKLGSGFYGNKYAYTAGLFTCDMAGLNNLDLRVEYSRSRPFLYTHKSNENGYSHFISPLGHWMGPNSDNLFLSIYYQFNRRTKINCFFEKTRHGANLPDINIGGNIFVPHTSQTDPENVEFLDGECQKLETIGLEFSYEIIHNCFIKSVYKNLRGDVSLLNSFLNEYIADGHIFLFQLELNY